MSEEVKVRVERRVVTKVAVAAFLEGTTEADLLVMNGAELALFGHRNGMADILVEGAVSELRARRHRALARYA